MAKRVSEEFVRTMPRRNKYPWHEWADGEWWQLERGEDFDVAANTITQAAKSWGERRGFKVLAIASGNMAYVKFIKDDAEKSE